MDDLAALHDEVRRRLETTPALVLAQIVRHRGSTPRKTGARMLIDPSGSHLGTVGGGCGEAEVMSRAHRVLGTGVSQLAEVSLLEEDGWESPSICGGVFDVFLERLGPDIGGMPADRFFSLIDQASAGGRAVAIATVIAAPAKRRGQPLVGRKTIIDERGLQYAPLGQDMLDERVTAAALEALGQSRPQSFDVELDGLADEAAFCVFVDLLCAPPELVVVGAGHVGTALVRLAGISGFSVTVLDDRLSFANPVRLPEAHRILTGDPRRALESLSPRRDCHVVLVTRGHRLDAECLRVALGMDLAYLGMIGSRRRVARIREQLVAEGVPPVKLESLHAPIGLDIGAETPAEIAIAVLAEIIDRRRRGRAAAVSMGRLARLR